MGAILGPSPKFQRGYGMIFRLVLGALWAGPASPPITAQHVPQGSATSGCQRGNREAGQEQFQKSWPARRRTNRGSRDSAVQPLRIRGRLPRHAPSVPKTTRRPLQKYCGSHGPGCSIGTALQSARFLSAACPGPGPWSLHRPQAPSSPQGVASTSSDLSPVPASAGALPCERQLLLVSLVSVD